VVASDNHGDMVDPESRAALMIFLGRFRPQIRIHAGDNYDLRALRKGASDKEKSESLKLDLEMGNQFALDFFRGGQENYFLRGNHDERLWRAAAEASGPLKDHAEEGVADITRLITKRCRATMLPYDSRLGILRLGHLKVIHGYASGIGAAAKHARVYRNCLFGHTHTIDTASVESDEGPHEARGIGAMCLLDMPYNSAQTNKLRHANGWAYGYLFEDGTYQLFQTRKINGHFYVATQVEAL
jgi:hypothetical protein